MRRCGGFEAFEGQARGAAEDLKRSRGADGGLETVRKDFGATEHRSEATGAATGAARGWRHGGGSRLLRRAGASRCGGLELYFKGGRLEALRRISRCEGGKLEGLRRFWSNLESTERFVDGGVFRWGC